MAWQRVASTGEISDGSVLGVEVDRTSVALYRLSNEIFATAGICTHALARLSEGWVEDGKIECPLHQGQFDIRSGKALCAPLTEDLRTYAVKVEGDDVFIDIERPAAAATAQAVPRARASAVEPASPGASAVVIVGGGQTAAAAVRSMRAAGFDGTIDLVGEEAHLPYERPPLSKDLLLGRTGVNFCRLSNDDAHRLGVRLHIGQRVTSIDPARRQVLIENGSRLPYGALLLATLVITLIGVRIYDTQRGLPLELWNIYAPVEMSADEIDHADWGQYLAAEQKVFEDVRAEVTAKLDPSERVPINRYFEGSPVYPGHFAQDWNRSYVLEPEGDPVGAVVVADRDRRRVHGTGFGTFQTALTDNG